MSRWAPSHIVGFIMRWLSYIVSHRFLGPDNIFQDKQKHCMLSNTYTLMGNRISVKENTVVVFFRTNSWYLCVSVCCFFLFFFWVFQKKQL